MPRRWKGFEQVDIFSLLLGYVYLYPAVIFSRGYFMFSADDKFGFIDKSGKIVIEPRFDMAHPFSED